METAVGIKAAQIMTRAKVENQGLLGTLAGWDPGGVRLKSFEKYVFK